MELLLILYTRKFTYTPHPLELWVLEQNMLSEEDKRACKILEVFGGARELESTTRQGVLQTSVYFPTMLSRWS